MAEETVWTGGSSQFKNLTAYALCGILFVGIVVVCYEFQPPKLVYLLALAPLVYGFWKYLLLKSHFYRLTTERLLTTQGLFSKTTETLELYRVKDMRCKQSFFERLVGLESVELLSSDVDTPDLTMDFIPASLKLLDKIREQVESCRVQKRTREIDLE
ncbi:MAG TPA: PH domain-containing protein [Chthoniobacteraceae bacterium]|nr:PH domain-containing protein [Chthoniobacteraceae bacterium]